MRLKQDYAQEKHSKKSPRISDEIQRRFLVKLKLTEVTSTVHSFLTMTVNTHVAVLKNTFAQINTVKLHALSAEIMIVGKDVPDIRRSGVAKLRNLLMYATGVLKKTGATRKDDNDMKWLMELMGMDTIPADDVHLNPSLLTR